MVNKDVVGSLTVITGCMFAGKTTKLLDYVDSLVGDGFGRLMLCKPTIDDRYEAKQIITHNGCGKNAIIANDTAALWQILNNQISNHGDIDGLVIDEVQFFDNELVGMLVSLAASGYQVVVAGLDTDFAGRTFGIMGDLLAQADQVIKLTATCAVCGKVANKTQRLVNGKPANKDSPIVVVGGSESYEARCRKCHVIGDD